MKKLIPVFILSVLTLIFFKSFILQGKLPIPADTIVGLYYPYRDFYAKDYPRGIPFKNFMITDPVRQQYPWKFLSVSLEKQKQLPLWNPYTFAGGPLLGNLQSGSFYPLNILFFLIPFPLAFGLYIFFEPLLLLIFMYLFLSSFKLDKKASILGAVTFGFCGFTISWLEWGTIIHTALWLPLILLSIDKSIETLGSLGKKVSAKSFKWLLILLISLLSSFFAGHLQIFFYISLLSLFYFIFRLYKTSNAIKTVSMFLGVPLLFLIFSLVKLIPSIRFILLSGRTLDQDWHTITGWFVPFQNLIQFIVPDFFGNPATLNYFGVWNYGEFVSYIGIGAVIFALFALFKKDKNVLFFTGLFLISILFALPTIIAKIPFKLEIPFLSSSQPTRLIFLADFSLSVLSAFGFDYFIKVNKKKKILWVLGILGVFLGLLWVYVLTSKGIYVENNFVSKQNLILPTVLFLVNLILITAVIFLNKYKKIKLSFVIYVLIVAVLFLDLLRFGWKYTPFTDQKYLYPTTKILDFLQKNSNNFRVISTDSGILPPNFSIMYKIQTLDGYDPLYLQRYGELMASLERGSSDIHAPFGFNRIITPQNYHSHLINLLGVKYVLSLNEISEPGFSLVFKEGGTLVYENKKVLPRIFFTENTVFRNNKKEAIDFMFANLNDLKTNAVVENDKLPKSQWSYLKATAEITKYSENKIIAETKNSGDGFLILTDSYYPTWHAKIDGKETKIYLTDYNFRGIIVPKGVHTIEYYISLF